MIHGDTSLCAGEIIDVDFPETKSTTGARKSDALVSGRFVVLRLRHAVIKDAKHKHTITADIAKLGYKA